MGNLRDLQAQSPRPKHKAFKACEPGYLHVDVKYLPQMANESSRRYLFVAIDRATRRVFIRICSSKTAANARRFLRDLERACPLRIRTVLTERAIDGSLGAVDADEDPAGRPINVHEQIAPRVRRENCPPDSFLIRLTIRHLRQILDIHMQIAGRIGLERLVFRSGDCACRSRKLPTPCRRKHR